MKLSYQVCRHLANKFCFGHNVGISALMYNDMVQIKVCCNYFRSEIEKELIVTYGQDFVANCVKFNCGGILTRGGYDSGSENEFYTAPDRLVLPQGNPDDE